MKKNNPIRKLILWCSILLSFATMKAQNLVEKTSTKLCDCLEQSDPRKLDSVDDCIIETFADPQYLQLPDSIYDKLYLRVISHLHKNCKRFAYIQENHAKAEGIDMGWKLVDTIATSTISDEDFESLFYTPTLYYHGDENTYIRVSLDTSYWIDHIFDDKYYSKCKVNWIKDKEFEIEFLESNDPIRQAYNKEGKLYQYRVLAKTKDYFLLVSLVGSIQHEFKLYLHNPSEQKRM